MPFLDQSITIPSNLVIDPGQVDAFGRIRTSTPYNVFHNKQISDNQPNFWDDAEVSGGGTSSTFNTNQASTTLAVSNNTAGLRARQTKRWFNYQSGKSQLIQMTGVLGSSKPGITTRLGQFNSSNEMFFQQSPDGLSVVVRTFTSGGVAETTVSQSSWNIDPLNGHGPSGIKLDLTKGQIFVIEYQWLGMGRIRFGFNFGGITVFCHSISNANSLSLVFISSPNLPLRYDIQNDGTGGVASIVHVCVSVISEGGVEHIGFQLSADRGATALSTLADTGIYPLIAIRLKAGYFGTEINISTFSIITTGANAYR